MAVNGQSDNAGMSPCKPSLLHRLRCHLQRYRAQSEGATAIEFAIVAIPFLALLMGILELALIFFVGSSLNHGISESGRAIRTGNFQACGGANEFKDMVCDRMSGLMNCHANLRIDVISADNFRSIAIPDAGMSGLNEPPQDRDGDGRIDFVQVSNGSYDNTAAGDPVVVRGTFYYPLILPTALTRLENRPGTGRHVITASTAFRNEPFPDGMGCNSTFASSDSEA